MNACSKSGRDEMLPSGHELRRRRAGGFAGLAAVVMLVAASSSEAAARWGPTWSEVTGNLGTRTKMNLRPATIKQIDGKHETARIVKAEPGRHEIVVASPMRKGVAGSDANFTMDLEPCKRYYVNVQFESGSGADWQPVLAFVEKIAGCKVP
jgi:hypothetical protein